MKYILTKPLPSTPAGVIYTRGYNKEMLETLEFRNGYYFLSDENGHDLDENKIYILEADVVENNPEYFAELQEQKNKTQTIKYIDDDHYKILESEYNKCTRMGEEFIALINNKDKRLEYNKEKAKQISTICLPLWSLIDQEMLTEKYGMGRPERYNSVGRNLIDICNYYFKPPLTPNNPKIQELKKIWPELAGLIMYADAPGDLL
jgi:hypothetical protein